MTLVFNPIKLVGQQMNENWIEKTPMPTKRAEISTVVANEKIYVAGGIEAVKSSKAFEVYDPSKDKWSKLPDLPKRLNHFGIASNDVYIYVSGGFQSIFQNKKSKILYRYDIAKEQWDVLDFMPDRRAAHSMVIYDNKLILIGGRDIEDTWTYDLIEQNWITQFIPQLPDLRDHINVLVNDNTLYVIGGRHNGNLKAINWMYSFSSKEWSSFSGLLTPSGGQSATIENGVIHVIGGEDVGNKKVFDRHDIYNLETQTWSKDISLPNPRHGHGTAIIDGVIYSIGGAEKHNIKSILTLKNDVYALAVFK